MTTIFISSRMNGEVDHWRQLAIQTIADTARTYSIDLASLAFEHKTCPPSTTTLDASLQWVRESNAFVAIYYKTASPVLVEEFRTANAYRLPIFIFVKRTARADLQPSELHPYDHLQQFLRTEARPPNTAPSVPGYVYKTFEGDDLALQIRASLLEYYPRRLDFIRVPDKYVFSRSDRDRLQVAARLWVPPQCYPQAMATLHSQRFLIIAGPAHAGKSTLTLTLANDLLQSGQARRILLYPPDGALLDIEGFTDSVIICDDPFGATRFNPYHAHVADRLPDFIERPSRPYVLIATRAEVLARAVAETKLGECAQLADLIVSLTPDSYTPEDRLQLLRHHVAEYADDPLDVAYALAHAHTIVDTLPMPHSYKMVVARGVAPARLGTRDLSELLRDANAIETVVGRWFEEFYRRDKEMFYFLLTLAMYPELSEGTFQRVHRLVVGHLKERRAEAIVTPSRHDLKRLVASGSPYVWIGRTVAFSHPSYREGVIQHALIEFGGDIEALLPCLEELAEDGNSLVRQSTIELLGEVWPKYPNDVVPLIGRLVASDWRREGDALNLFSEIGQSLPDVALSTLKKLWDYDNPGVREDARRVCAMIGAVRTDEMLSFVLEYAEDRHSGSRSDAILALAPFLRLRFDTLVPLVREWLNDDDPWIRRASVLCMRETAVDRPQDVVSLVAPCLEDPEWCVRCAAEFVVGKAERPVPE